ncbi:MAG: BrnA antitoxin family protein [Rhodospirillaceae bacterium]|nr:BrnA antitoxin family protein [Rhodospirillaceae bacterium]
MSHEPVFDKDNPEWTEEDFKRARPASELPPEILAAFPRTRGPQKAPKKVPVSLRLSPDVIEHFKAGGPGWQSRIDDTLRKFAGLK